MIQKITAWQLQQNKIWRLVKLPSEFHSLKNDPKLLLINY